MLSMNDFVKITMTLSEAHLLKSHLAIEKHENLTGTSRDVISRLLERVESSLRNLDFSDNEKHVDEHNEKVRKEAEE